MRNPQHYYNWTIEGEEYTGGQWIFYLCREVFEPYQGTSSRLCTQIGVKNDRDKAISQSEDLIDEIIHEQNKIAEKINFGKRNIIENPSKNLYI